MDSSFNDSNNNNNNINMVEVILIIAAMIGFTVGLYIVEIFYNWLNKK